MRALAGIQVKCPNQLPAAIDALYEASWVRHDDVTSPDAVSRILASAIGESNARAAMEAVQGEGKKKLMANTEEAFESGAFGLPWFVCEKGTGESEGFWGVDHIGQVLDFLGLGRPSELRAQL